MTNKHIPESTGQKLAFQLQPETVQVIRHNQVCQKLQISSAKLFEMVATGIFPKPFQLIPGGRAVGWLETDVSKWILDRKQASKQEVL